MPVFQENNTNLINSKGVNVGSTYLFLKAIKTYADQFNSRNVYIAWDKKKVKGPSFRDTLTSGTYKDGRNESRNAEVYAEVDNIVKAVTSLGIKNVFPGTLEADDVISYLSSSIPGKKVIISVDKDFLQLITPDISYFNPIKKQIIDVSNFESLFDLTPKEFLYFKAITGDVSDNIRGIPGVAKVKGTRLAKAYSLFKANTLIDKKLSDTLSTYDNVIRDNLKLVDLSYSLTQHTEEVGFYKSQIESLVSLKPDFNAFKELITDLEFPSIINNINEWQGTFNKKSKNDILTDYFKNFS